MSMYGDYLRERLGKCVLEWDEGFAVYWFLTHPVLGGCVYIEEIYVDPLARRAGIAAAMANMIAAEAKERDVRTMLGSVNPTTNGATTSLKVLLGYGMELSHVGADGLIYFKKSLGG